MIGSGILNQPQVYALSGVAAAVIMSVIASVLIWLGLISLIDMGEAFNIHDYSELAKFAFGKGGELTVDFFIAIGNLGALISYIIVIGSTASDLLFSWGCDVNNEGCSVYVMTSLIMLLFVFPICLMRVFGHLAFYSVMSMIAIGSIVILTIVAGPIVGGNIGRTVVFQNQGVIQQLGSIIFALSCAFATFHTYISLDQGTAKRWRVVTAKAIVLGFLMCFIIGMGQ